MAGTANIKPVTLELDRFLASIDVAREALAETSIDLDTLLERVEPVLATLKNGDLPRWLSALDALPAVAHRAVPARPAPRLGGQVEQPEALIALLQAFHPWRKGPLVLGGVAIDTEWRSDWKWARIEDRVDFQDCAVLDVGCGNGYFGWRMLGAGARCVIGIDPTILFLVQWLVQQHFSGAAPNVVLPLRDTDLPDQPGGFDRVCSMGVLYHRRDPEDHLRRLFRAGRPGGKLLLETLVLSGSEPVVLKPDGRYARMRNVHQLPSVPYLLNQLKAVGFEAPQLLDETVTSIHEQRSTAWMRFESLTHCLDAQDPTRTVEGHPAPVRALLVADIPAD